MVVNGEGGGGGERLWNKSYGKKPVDTYATCMVKFLMVGTNLSS